MSGETGYHPRVAYGYPMIAVRLFEGARSGCIAHFQRSSLHLVCSGLGWRPLRIQRLPNRRLPTEAPGRQVWRQRA